MSPMADSLPIHSEALPNGGISLRDPARRRKGSHPAPWKGIHLSLHADDSISFFVTDEPFAHVGDSREQRRTMAENGRHAIIEHLDLLRLDAVRAGEGTPEESAHAAHCPACRGELEALKRLAEGIAGLAPPAVEVPKGVDEAILAGFRRSAAPGAKVIRFPAWRWAAPAIGVAVAAGVAWLSLVPQRTAPQLPALAQHREEAPATGDFRSLGAESRVAGRLSPAEPQAAEAKGKIAARGETAAIRHAAAADVNRDGRVDILDAYRLALLIAEDRGDAATWDENGDGTVDRKDVDALATLAVAL